jgi:hypothetical protein
VSCAKCDFDVMLDINMIHGCIFLAKIDLFSGICSCFQSDKTVGLKCIWVVTDLFLLGCNVV